MKKKTRNILLIILAALILIGGASAWFVYKYVYNKPHPDYETAIPAIYVKAKELFTEYSDNPDAANQKYLDKVVEIAGDVSSVEQVDSLVIVVFAFNKGVFGDEGIRVTMLPGYREQALSLDSNAPIRLKGHCTGYNDTDVILESGSIVKVEE
jgi:hypothetical protein